MHVLTAISICTVSQQPLWVQNSLANFRKKLLPFTCGARDGCLQPRFLSDQQNGCIKDRSGRLSVCKIRGSKLCCSGKSDDCVAGGGQGSEADGGDNGGRRLGVSKTGSEDGFWARYKGFLSHPLVFKGLIVGLLNATADVTCQVMLERVDNIDVKRLLSFTTVGMFLSGPGLHIWYEMLPKLISVSGIEGVVLRTAADQLIFTPLAMGSLFVVLLFLEGRSDQIMTKLQQEWLPTIVANWTVWIPFQIINFGVVPRHLQVLATSALGMLWSIYFSFTGHA